MQYAEETMVLVSICLINLRKVFVLQINFCFSLGNVEDFTVLLIRVSVASCISRVAVGCVISLCILQSP
jgi:hypothetical protein